MKVLGYILVILLSFLLLSSGMWYKTLTIILILICFRLGLKEKNYFNPYILLSIPLISYFFYYSDLAPGFLSELQWSTDLLILMCFSALIVGFTIVKYSKLRAVKTKFTYNENFWVICILGLFPTALSYILYGSIFDASGAAMLDIKEKQSLPIIGQLAYFLPASIIVACKNNNSMQIIIAIVLSMLAAIMTLTKTAMLVALIFTVIGLYVFEPNILNSKIAKFLKKYAFILLPVLILYMFMANNSVRHEASTSSSMEYIEQGGGKMIHNRSDFAQGMFLNYLYFCSPWSNLDYNVQRIHEPSYGTNTFAQFAKKVGIEIQTVEKLEPTFLNTHSFITDFYIDFGYLGAIVASFLLGCIIYFFYSKFYFSNDALLLAYYCLISYATIMLFFSNHFINGYLLNYLITFGGYYLIMHTINVKLS